MSTRSNITFHTSRPDPAHVAANADAILYRHRDGYPDGPYGVLADLLPFLADFASRRGLGDSEYAAARCLQHLTNRYDDHDGVPGILGYGISTQLAGDAKYVYAVYPDAVDVYETATTATGLRLITTVEVPS